MSPTEPFLDDLAAVLRFFFDIFGVVYTRGNLLVSVGKGRQVSAGDLSLVAKPVSHNSLELIGSRWTASASIGKQHSSCDIYALETKHNFDGF